MKRSNIKQEKTLLKTLEESWATETLKEMLVGIEQEVRVEEKKEYFEVLHAPYIKGFSEGLGRKLRRLGIGFVPKRGETIYTNVCKLKQKKELEERKNVIYAVECGTCGLHYIGGTGQHCCDRRSQHQRNVTQKKSSNGIYDHVKNNEGHQTDWGKVCFLDNEKNLRGRKN